MKGAHSVNTELLLGIYYEHKLRSKHKLAGGGVLAG